MVPMTTDGQEWKLIVDGSSLMVNTCLMMFITMVVMIVIMMLCWWSMISNGE